MEPLILDLWFFSYLFIHPHFPFKSLISKRKTPLFILLLWKHTNFLWKGAGNVH